MANIWYNITHLFAPPLCGGVFHKDDDESNHVRGEKDRNEDIIRSPILESAVKIEHSTISNPEITIFKINLRISKAWKFAHEG